MTNHLPLNQKLELLGLNQRNRVECLRLMLHYSGQPFLDRRLTIAQWKDMRLKEGLNEDTKLPVLKVGAKKRLIGALEIGRFLAVNLGLYGSSSREQEQIDKIILDLEIINNKIAPIIRATLTKSFEKRKEMWDEFKAAELGNELRKLTSLLGDNHLFVGNRVTWADIAVAEMLSRFASCFDSFFLPSWPALKAHMDRVERLPLIVDYVRDRPSTHL